MSVNGAIESKRRLASRGMGLRVLLVVLVILTVLRKNIIGLSVGQFVQFWPIVLFLSYQIVKCII